jgi:hypothetical protein
VPCKWPRRLMESELGPLKHLAEEAAWFARDRDLRVLQVRTTVDLREPVLAVVMGQEFHADNRSPFVRLDDAFTTAAPAWRARARRLCDQHERRREDMAAEGASLPALRPLTAARDELASFAAQLREVADARCAPLEGLVVVLAPTRLDDPVAFEGAVRALVAAPTLNDVRWVLVLVEGPGVSRLLQELLQELGGKALTVDCRPDPAAQTRELDQMLAAAASAPADAVGPAKIGAAWPPGVSPPPRLNRPPPSPAQVREVLAAAGLPPSLADGTGDELRRLVLGGAVALRQGRGPEAVRLQREARDLCQRHGMVKESLIMELALGTYLVQLGQRALAITTLRAVVARAEEARHPQEGVQAHLALGMLYTLERKPLDASLAYVAAGRLAQQAGLDLLGIEAYRLAGSSMTDPGHKAKAWRAALDIARAAPPPEARASSAAETARALAALLRASGLHRQAEALEQESVSLEAGETAPPAPLAVASR